MQREIKFRGKRVDNDKWIAGVGVVTNGSRKHVIESRDYARPSTALLFIAMEVIPETVGQYTGLQDKNGNKIYEGDILHRSLPVDRTRIVHFEMGGFAVKNIKTEDRLMHNSFPISNSDYWEIIGNIYENPDLLKGGTPNEKQIHH